MCIVAKHTKFVIMDAFKLVVVKSMNFFEKEKKDRVPFLRQSEDQRMGRKHLAVYRQQTSLRAAKVLSTAKTNH